MANEFVIKNGYFSQGNSNITGSLTVTGGVTASLQGTASFALTASYSVTAASASYVLNAVSASYSLTASYAMNGGGTTVDTGSFVTTSSFNAYTGSAASRFAGTASFATTAATASYILNAVSSSFATTASYYVETDPVFVSKSGSFTTTSSFNSFTSSYATGSFTGSFIGDGSGLTGVISSSYAVSSSYALSALSSSYAVSASYSATASLAVTSLNASDILIYVKNTTGAAINKGTVVRISGATGDNALIATASYEADNNSANTLGILNETIADQAFGYAMTEGKLLGINTDAFTAGQLLYLGATGSIIGYEPKAPLHAVRLGQALRIQQNNGSMYVRIDNGYELDELHNVLIISGSDGDLLVASGSNGNGKKLYINSRQLTGSYGLTGSLNVIGSVIGSFTGSLQGTASYSSNSQLLDGSDKAVFATTGSNIFKASQTITGSLTITNDLIVFGSSSIQYITSSQLNIADNIITVNTITPAIRFGGIAVNDSGSATPRSGSLLFDSEQNQWLFVHQDGSGAVTSSLLIMGAETYNNIGNETHPTTNRIMKSLNDEHIGDSNITDTGTIVSINSNTEITGSLSQGLGTNASGSYSHAEGYNTQAKGQSSHAEGYGSIALGGYSHAEGDQTTALGEYSHAEGQGTVAFAGYSHAEGIGSIASGAYSHAEGTSYAYGTGAHSEGWVTIASGSWSHAEGYYTIASGSYQHVSGKYNKHGDSTSLFIIGNGTSDVARSDIFRVTNTNIQVSGSLLVSGSVNITNSLTVGGTIIGNGGMSMSGSNSVTGSMIITGSTTTDLVRITQTGAGNAFVVEDSSNPDSSAFVIDASGSVGIGVTPSNVYKLYVQNDPVSGLTAPIFAQNGWAANGTAIYAVTSVPSLNGTSYGIRGESGENGTSNIGVYGYGWNYDWPGGINKGGYFIGEGGSTNIGVDATGQASGNPGTLSIGGKFTAQFSTNNYAVQLIDGTQTVAGRFLINQTTDGKANWGNSIPSIQVTSAITGSTNNNTSTDAMIQASLLYLSNNC